jgi:hypothetical protein
MPLKRSSVRSSFLRSPVIIALSLIVMLCLAVTPLFFAQSITGDIPGTVRDASGAVVPGARVTLTATDTGIKAEAISDSDGNYLFAQLKPGRYSVSVFKEGCATSTVSNIDRLAGG